MILAGIPISENQCIGDSLQYINSAFQTLSSSKANNLSVVDSPTIDLSYNSTTGILSANATISIVDSPTIDLSYNSTTGNLSAVTTSFVATSSSPMVAKAWGVFNGVTPAILENYNIAGFARTAQGRYTITLQNLMPNTNYVILASSISVGIVWAMPVWHYGGKLVNSFDLWFGDSDNPGTYYDSVDFSVVVFS